MQLDTRVSNRERSSPHLRKVPQERKECQRLRIRLNSQRRQHWKHRRRIQPSNPHRHQRREPYHLPLRAPIIECDEKAQGYEQDGPGCPELRAVPMELVD